jgi:zinc transporter, ZIP family
MPPTACVAGASVIYVDLIVRLIPGYRDFKIQESNGFLASSLSLSFGVMVRKLTGPHVSHDPRDHLPSMRPNDEADAGQKLFSALYSMLPSAKRYLDKGGVAEPASGFIMMGCFVGGFFGIQIISRILHQFIPSHVVDCDHTHDDKDDDGHSHTDGFSSRRQSRASHSRARSLRRRSSAVPPSLIKDDMIEVHGNGLASESTPLLTPSVPNGTALDEQSVTRDVAATSLQGVTPIKSTQSRANTQTQRRPSIAQMQNRVLSFVKDTKSDCGHNGPCYGYTDPCGQECFKHLSSRTSTFNPRAALKQRSTTGSFHPRRSIAADVPEDEEAGIPDSPVSPTRRTTRAASRDAMLNGALRRHSHVSTHLNLHSNNNSRPTSRSQNDRSTDPNFHPEDAGDLCSQFSEGDSDAEAQQHHHHVPTNGFLAIGLQTVIAIGIHKFPEGFITYATNHANPTLGFNVFMALFVHNIAEGFAMALPLYLALNSRLKAMLWSSLLGGFSQPIGAGLAAIWFKVAKRSHVEVDATAYACLFATTAGIMTSVALQLFVESLSLNHGRNLSIFFAFLGMTLLGVSNALVAN